MQTEVANFNPFQNASVVARPNNANAMGDAEQHRAVAETQAGMIIAKRFPRDQVQAMDHILQACTRPTLAESALYSYSRGGADITGPSIRLAEAIAQSWGNIQFGIRELSQQNGESTVEAFAWDIETNTRQVKVFQVPHTRYTKKGSYRLEDPRDIYEMVANQGARRLRACILGVIPGDVIETAVKQCETTLTIKAEVTPERLQSLLEKFASYKVTKEMIEKRIQRRLDAMTPALLVQLGKIYNSLKDGMSVAADWFEPGEEAEQPRAGSQTSAVKEKLKAKKEEPAAHDTITGEVAEAEPDALAEVLSPLPEFSAKLIPAPIHPLDSTRTDWTLWAQKWKQQVSIAPTAKDLIALKKANDNLLNNLQRLEPEIYTECADLYVRTADTLAAQGAA
jgi:hypothetical protein